MKVKNVANLKYVMLSNGLVVNKDHIVGVQPNPENKNEFYVHTTTSQYYKITAEDYAFLVIYGLGINIVEAK